MSLLPVFVEWSKPNEKQIHRVPVVQFSTDLDTALIVFDKQFIKVNLEEIRFSKWDL